MDKPAYLFVGDPFLTGEKVKSLLKAIEENNRGEISCQTCHLPETSLEAVLTQARTLPFFTTGQIFRLKNAELLNKNDLAILANYLANPAQGSHLIFESESLEKSNELVKLIQGQGEVYFLDERQKKDAGMRFLQEKLKPLGKSITPQALAKLQEDAGGNPVFLDSMLDRLVTYAGEQSQITETMVETFQEGLGETSVFQLTDAIAARQTGTALAFLQRLTEDTEKDWVSLLGLLHWQIRRFWQAKVLEEEKKYESVILKKCRVSPRQSPFFLRQLKLFSRERLEKALEGLFQLDWKMKTGRADGPAALEAWVVETTS